MLKKIHNADIIRWYSNIKGSVFLKGITVKELFGENNTLASELLNSVTYPFEALAKISDYI